MRDWAMSEQSIPSLEEWLHEQYIECDMSQQEIADLLNCEQPTVSKLLNDYDISIDGDCRYRDESWLREKYIQQNMTMQEIAEMCDVCRGTVSRWIKRHDIETRPAHGREGKDNPKWAGGESFGYGSGWTERKRERVRELDNHRCIDCDMSQSEHQSRHDCKLHVHHLIKAREIDDAEIRNAVDNLVTLCASCHHKWEQMSKAGIKPDIDRSR
jgi:predicted DNA-binding protein YlxM (UPF0122 family)